MEWFSGLKTLEQAVRKDEFHKSQLFRALDARHGTWLGPGFTRSFDAVDPQQLQSSAGELRNGAHVLGAFEGAGFGAVLLAHAAFELAYGSVFMFFHPRDEIALDNANLPRAMPDEG